MTMHLHTYSIILVILNCVFTIIYIVLLPLLLIKGFTDSIIHSHIVTIITYFVIVNDNKHVNAIYVHSGKSTCSHRDCVLRELPLSTNASTLSNLLVVLRVALLLDHLVSFVKSDSSLLINSCRYNQPMVINYCFEGGR